MWSKSTSNIDKVEFLENNETERRNRIRITLGEKRLKYQAQENTGELFDVYGVKKYADDLPLRNEIIEITKEINYQAERIASQLERHSKDIKDIIINENTRTINILSKECKDLKSQNEFLIKKLSESEKNYKNISYQFEELRKINNSISELISTKYKAKQLLIGTALSTIAMIGVLSLYFLKNVSFIDPLISSLVLFVSISFMGLSIYRLKEDKGNKDG